MSAGERQLRLGKGEGTPAARSIRGAFAFHMKEKAPRALDVSKIPRLLTQQKFVRASVHVP